MMHGRGKSDAAIVAEKPTNKAERSAAEPVEPRAVAKGNANQQSTQPGAAPGKRVTGAGAHTIRRESGAPVGPEVGAVCGQAARTDLCGGREETRVPTAKVLFAAVFESAVGIVSRVSPVHTAVRNCTRDEGGPFEVGNQVLISSHRKLLSLKATVVNVAEKPGQDSGRHG